MPNSSTVNNGRCEQSVHTQVAVLTLYRLVNDHGLFGTLVPWGLCTANLGL